MNFIIQCTSAEFIPELVIYIPHNIYDTYERYAHIHGEINHCSKKPFRQNGFRIEYLLPSMKRMQHKLQKMERILKVNRVVKKLIRVNIYSSPLVMEVPVYQAPASVSG
jgi:hypothetical protein